MRQHRPSAEHSLRRFEFPVWRVSREGQHRSSAEHSLRLLACYDEHAVAKSAQALGRAFIETIEAARAETGDESAQALGRAFIETRRW